ncbi:sigma-70 family RNA polymerase sigma factor [Planctomycetales bacterium ZRK34]|nr:sigma-70 family RNA polymerase sigma factor [Planctomycetales bacterium ZRK34]
MQSEQHEQFAKQFIRCQGKVYGYIATLLPRADDAEEVFQQTSLVLWKKWDEFDLSRPFVPWACSIAHFEVMNFLRRQRTGRVFLSDSVMAQVAADRLDAGEDLDRRSEALSRCLEQLPDAQRDLVERCYVSADSIKHVAAEMGRTANSVYMTLRRIRTALLDCVRSRIAQEDVR